MKKYLLLLVMFIATIGYIAGLYGFFHNLNFIFHEITITPMVDIEGDVSTCVGNHGITNVCDGRICIPSKIS